MKSTAETVDAYLAALPDDRRDALTQLRTLIRAISPDILEKMAYGMPSYDFQGPLFSLASQKAHLALYVCVSEVVETHRTRLGKLDCGKGCIRFKRITDLPMEVIGDILRESFQQRQSM